MPRAFDQMAMAVKIQRAWRARGDEPSFSSEESEELNLYKVYVTETMRWEYEVWAHDADEAMEIFEEEGEGEMMSSRKDAESAELVDA